MKKQITNTAAIVASIEVIKDEAGYNAYGAFCTVVRTDNNKQVLYTNLNVENAPEYYGAMIAAIAAAS
jgi:hypothetical protein